MRYTTETIGIYCLWLLEPGLQRPTRRDYTGNRTAPTPCDTAMLAICSYMSGLREITAAWKMSRLKHAVGIQGGSKTVKRPVEYGNRLRIDLRRASQAL